MKKQNIRQKHKRTAAILEDQERNIRSNGKQITPRAEEGYCNEATQSGPLTHSQSHQAQNTAEHTEVKQRRAWTREEIREVVWCYMYCRQHFTENYKKMYEIWRQHKPESRMYMDAKKLMNLKNYVMKLNKITEKEIRGNKEETASKSEKSPRRKERRRARTPGYHKG